MIIFNSKNLYFKKDSKDIKKIDPYPFVNNNRGAGFDKIEPVQVRNDPNNIYARYHKQLDEHAEKRKPIQDQQDAISNRLKEPSPSPVQNYRPSPSPIPRQISNNQINKAVNKNKAAIDEYLKRKEEFARNKARGKAFFDNPISARPPVAKKDEKSAYEEKLKQIRRQNYRSRKPISKIIDNEISRQSIEKQSYVNNRMKRVAALKVFYCKFLSKNR